MTVKGYVKTYSGTPEFDKNNQLVSHSRPTNTDPTITLDPSTINVDAEEHFRALGVIADDTADNGLREMIQFIDFAKL